MDIKRLVIPYKDIYTTVYVIHTALGDVLFDTGAGEADAEQYILPFKQGVTADTLKYVVISHNHRDHAPGLPRIKQEFPSATVVASDADLSDLTVPSDGVVLLDVLRIIPTPGHDVDCCSLLDTRTDTLLTSDALQMYGIVSESPLGAHLRAPSAYLHTLDVIAALSPNTILTAHDFQPFGYRLDGAEHIEEALAICRATYQRLHTVVAAHPTADTETIRRLYATHAPWLPIGDLAIEAMKNSIDS